MPQLDRFLTLLVSHHGTALRLDEGAVAQLETGGALRPVTKQPLGAAQIEALLREIAPADAVAALASRSNVTFAYETAEGPFEVSAGTPDGQGSGAAGGGWAAVIRPSTAEQPAAPATLAATPAVAGAADARAARAELEALLRALSDRGASDLHLRVGEPPLLRLHGEMIRLTESGPVANDHLEAMLQSIMPQRNRDEYADRNDTDFAHEIAGLARFRCNALRDRKGAAAVFRVIPAKLVTADELGISAEVQRLCHLTRGLVLVTGPTGSGKSTTLCALIDLINRERTDHVITIEDPIEFVHENKKCLITQRQVGVHTSSFKNALRAALREDPDIILVGELRDLETVSIAIETAETGHLVFGTLHTTTAASTIDRLIDQFPPDRQEQVRVMLSESLKGVISQTLCKKIGGGRSAAREILLTIPAIANLIREGKTFQIPSIIQTSKRLGMVTLNDALMELVEAGEVEPSEAYYKANDKQGIASMLRQRGHDVSFLEPTDAGATPAASGAGGNAAGAPRAPQRGVAARG